MVHVDLDALRAAAGAADRSAGALRDVDVTTPFTDAGGALPGSATGEACLWIGTRLGAAVQVFADDVASLADAARLVALDLESTDTAVSCELGGP